MVYNGYHRNKNVYMPVLDCTWYNNSIIKKCQNKSWRFWAIAYFVFLFHFLWESQNTSINYDTTAIIVLAAKAITWCIARVAAALTVWNWWPEEPSTMALSIDMFVSAISKSRTTVLAWQDDACADCSGPSDAREDQARGRRYRLKSAEKISLWHQHKPLAFGRN